MRARFHAEPIVQATELLLQERTPRDVAVAHPQGRGSRRPRPRCASSTCRRCGACATPHDATPQTHLLSNGRYAVMLTAAGSGYSRWRDLAITRWREDATRDDWGSYVFLRDVASGARWSAGYQPSGVEPDALRRDVHRGPRRVRAAATARSPRPSKCSSRRRTTPRCAACRSRTAAARAREIELTSYAELVLAPPAADAAHPAFSKLFVQTEYLAEARRPARDAAARARRASPRSGPRISPWSKARAWARPEFETDRARFLGRGRERRARRSR